MDIFGHMSPSKNIFIFKFIINLMLSHSFIIKLGMTFFPIWDEILWDPVPFGIEL